MGDVVAGQSHAWVEYFSGAWTGMDPTNGVRETERHIIVGNGRDYDDVAPLKGVYQGPAASSLGVIVEMSPYTLSRAAPAVACLDWIRLVRTTADDERVAARDT